MSAPIFKRIEDKVLDDQLTKIYKKLNQNSNYHREKILRRICELLEINNDERTAIYGELIYR